MKNIRLFANEAQYNAAYADGKIEIPTVSYIRLNDELKYDTHLYAVDRRLNAPFMTWLVDHGYNGESTDYLTFEEASKLNIYIPSTDIVSYGITSLWELKHFTSQTSLPTDSGSSGSVGTLQYLYIPDTVSGNKSSTRMVFSSLKKIHWGDGLTAICNYRPVPTIQYIGKNVTAIGSSTAIPGKSSTKKIIICAATTCPSGYFPNQGASGYTYEGMKLYVPDDLVSTYQANSNWVKFKNFGDGIAALSTYDGEEY